MNKAYFSFLDGTQLDDYTSSFLPGHKHSKQKSELEQILEQSDIGNITYNIERQNIKKRIISDYHNAKRKILYHYIDKKIPILKDIDIEQKKIDELGPILPILEEKLVNDPNEKNIRVHHIPAKAKIISHKIIKVQEALPPKPLEITIHIPYGFYVLGKIEEEDKFYDTSRYFQHIRLLLNTIGEIEKQIGEKIQVNMLCEDNVREESDIDRDKSTNLSNKEKQERSKQIFEWIKKHYKAEYPLSLRLYNDSKKDKNRTKGGNFGLRWKKDIKDSILYNKPISRELNMLENILGKDKGYFGFKDASTYIEISEGDIINNGNNIITGCERYFKELFSF